MPKKRKGKDIIKEKGRESVNSDSWAEDQARGNYYYDDSHGYEIYRDEECEDEADQQRISPSKKKIG